MSVGCPFVSLMSLRNNSISCVICVSRDLLPTPKFLSVERANDRCSFHSSPDDEAIPVRSKHLHV